MNKNQKEIKEINDLLETTAKGIMAQIRAVLCLSVKSLVLLGISEEIAYEFYREVLKITQKEMGFTPIEEDNSD